MWGKDRVVIYDSGKIEKVEGDREKRKLLESCEWTNYIVLFKSFGWEGRSLGENP